MIDTTNFDVVARLRELAEADLRELARDIPVMGLTIDADELRRWADAMDAAADELDRLRTLLSSSRGEQAWIPIDHAPKSRPIIGKTAAGRIVKAKWVRLDDDTAGWGTPEEDDPRPNCWDDGFCWASNSDEMPSDPLVAYIEMPGSVPTSLAGQVPDGYAKALQEISALAATFDDEREAGYIAVAKLGRIARAALIAAAPQPTAGGDAPDRETVLQSVDQFLQQWRATVEMSNGHDVIANANTVRRFLSIADALSAERARVIASCEAAIRTVIDPVAEDLDSVYRAGAIACLNAIRALGQQDTGGADGSDP